MTETPADLSLAHYQPWFYAAALYLRDVARLHGGWKALLLGG